MQLHCGYFPITTSAGYEHDDLALPWRETTEGRCRRDPYAFGD